MKCIVVDDEPMARELLKDLIGKSSVDLTIVGEGGDVDSAKELIKYEKPDVVFLDIRIHERLGFEVLDAFQERTFKVIFTTAFDNYAVDAFKYGAVHYLMKPYDLKSLEEALARCFASDDKNNRGASEENSNSITIQSRTESLRLKVADILYLIASGAYTEIYLRDGKTILASKSLGHFEKQLPEDLFIRVHKQNLINIQEVRSYEKGMNAVVVMSDGNQLSVSRSKKSILNSIL